MSLDGAARRFVLLTLGDLLLSLGDNLPRQEAAIVAEVGELPRLEVVLDAVDGLARGIADGDHRLGPRVLEAELERRLGTGELHFFPGGEEIVLLELVGEDHRALAARIDIDQREVAILLRLDVEHRQVVDLVVVAIGGEREIEVVGLLLRLAADLGNIGSA